MQISIQSLEIEFNKTPHRFIVKKLYNTSQNELLFHCWAPEDSIQSKELIDNEVLVFEWDIQHEELKPRQTNPVGDKLKQAIRASFEM